MPSPQPANYATASRYFDGPVKYKVIRSNGRELLLENNLCRSLYVGQRLSVEKDVYAIVTRVEGELALAIMTQITSPSFVTVDDWAPMSLPESKLLIDPAQAGELYARCSNTLTEKPGYVGWSLFNGDRQLLAIGNDYSNHNICSIKGTGFWQQGVYILEVRSFLTGSLHPINYASKRWFVNTATPTLSVGALNDGQASLILS